MSITCMSDLLIVGGGPAGLAAAINGASEGLAVRILDNGSTIGGQAKESSAIENYPGFPVAITGADLMGNMAQQARKFDTLITSPVMAVSLTREEDGSLRVTCDDDSEYTARAVLLAMGLQYRRLPATNVSMFNGRDIFYGVPQFKIQSKRVKTVAVVGGANSAGQAALGLAANAHIQVLLFVRSSLEKGMSTYLIDRIKQTPNIRVLELCSVDECFGDHCLTKVRIVHDGVPTTIDVDRMHIFIGAMPRTWWLKGVVELDKDGFVATGPMFGNYLATSMRGVFAAGDVRSGSIKRVVAAAGEGGTALQLIHGYLGGL